MGKLAFWGGVAGAAKGAQQAIQLGVQERWRKQDQMREERLMKLRQEHDKGMQDDRHKSRTSEREAAQAFAAGQAETGHERALELADVRGENAQGAVRAQYEAMGERDAEMEQRALDRPQKLADKYGVPPEMFLPITQSPGGKPNKNEVGYGVERIGKVKQTVPPERDERGNVLSLGGDEEVYVHQVKGLAGQFVDYNGAYINKKADIAEVDQKMQEAQGPHMVKGKEVTMPNGSIVTKEAYAVANFRLPSHTDKERLKIRKDFFRVWKYVPDGMY